MSVAELEENEVVEDEIIEVKEADETVDSDQTEDDVIVSEDATEVVEDDDIEVSFDGESLTPEDDKEEETKPWVKDLRKNHKVTQRENRELKKKLAEIEQLKTVQPEVLKPTKKPTLEDFDYESAPFEEAIDKWYIAEKKHEEVRSSQEAEQKRQTDEWQEKLDSYEVSKKKLRVKDYEEAEDYVVGNLSDTQRGIIVQGSENPALSFYAIGKNKKIAKELASITDPVKFAFAVSKMENKLKTTSKKSRPNPESALKSGGGNVGKDTTLERLQADADKTGDRSKVFAYKMKLRQKN